MVRKAIIRLVTLIMTLNQPDIGLSAGQAPLFPGQGRVSIQCLLRRVRGGEVQRTPRWTQIPGLSVVQLGMALILAAIRY